MVTDIKVVQSAAAKTYFIAAKQGSATVRICSAFKLEKQESDLQIALCRGFRICCADLQGSAQF